MSVIESYLLLHYSETSQTFADMEIELTTNAMVECILI